MDEYSWNETREVAGKIKMNEEIGKTEYVNQGCLLRIDNVLRPGAFENFRKIMDVVNKQEITSIIDVTPKWHGISDHNPEYVLYIKDQLAKGHALALHGIEHRCRILPEAKHQISWLPSEDEFHCKDYHAIHGEDIPIDTQRQWLREGNETLYDLFEQRTNLLMPPAHAYNSNTLKAMKLEGFKGIADYGRWDAYPFPQDEVVVFPFDFEDYMKNTKEDGSNKEAMMEMFRRYFNAAINQKGYYGTFVHCDFSNDGTASKERLQMLDEMICYVKEQGHEFVDPQVFLNKT